ncbi:actin nucleation-promoting factor WASL [Patella vulgata]|uniref:actin nucleation-promoting factor WASL n=1 Tax=Patella vulgata TaxID=6465 RepID=UPI0024A823A6|nr:actin nucleation-promoting factor WASL [Patella vulgata]
MSHQRPKATNKASLLLLNDENEALFALLGKGCVTLATGIVQLYLSDLSDNHRWNKRCCGVAAFVKDNTKRSYYIRVFDLKKQSMIWEQELYNQFRYKSPRDYFHTFECDKTQAGLNFASEDEANLFKSAVEQKLHERSLRKQEKKQRTVHHNNRPVGASNPPSAGSVGNQTKVTTNVDNKINGSGTLSKKNKKEKKKGKLTKDDIGTPTNFKHVSHVGWDPNKGFDMNNLEPEMQNLFQSVGISSDDPVDKETVDFIYDFVEKHGGMDAVKKEIAGRPAPPPPPSGPRGGAPPPPVRSTNSSAPPPPYRGAQPPLPPSRFAGGRPAPPQCTPSRTAVKPPNAAPPPPPPVSSSRPPPPPGAGIPPPTPPPPPPAVGAAPPAPPPPPPSTPFAPSGAVTDGRSNLLDAIRAGKTLHSVETSSGESIGDERDQLLKQIQSGSKLKKVDHQVQAKTQSVNEQDGLVGALARALANRQRAVRGSDDDDSDDDEDSDDNDDDEWDD